MTGPSPKTRSVGDGIEIAYLEWGTHDDSPLVVLVHATGFCKEVCVPVVDDLAARRSRFRAVAVDMRGHGDSEAPVPPLSWWDIARDIIELVGDSSPVVGVGHSAGAAALLLAELMEPGVFDSFVLVEPIIFPPPYGRFPDNPMSNAARRRRDRFASPQAAFDNWRPKAAFAGWEERALWAYVNGGLREQDGEYVLKCTRETEAETFIGATEHGAWDRLGELDPETLVIAGEYSTTHQMPFLGELASRIRSGSSEIVPATSHMVWMERPGLIAARVDEAVSSLVTPGH